MDHQEIMNRVSPRPFTLYYRASLFSGREKGWVREENSVDENNVNMSEQIEFAQRRTALPKHRSQPLVGKQQSPVGGLPLF